MALALNGGRDRLKREDQTARFLAWYAAAPHAGKTFPDLKTFMGLDAKAEGKPGPAERLDLDTAMRRWAAAQNAVEAHKAAMARKRRRPKPTPPAEGEPNARV